MVDAHGGMIFNEFRVKSNGIFFASWVIYEMDEIGYVDFSIRAPVNGSIYFMQSNMY